MLNGALKMLLATDYGLRGCVDHVLSSKRGGSDDDDNLVPCCSRCNSIKNNRTVEAARPFLLQARFGWPGFSPAQLDWLTAHGFDTTPITEGRLYFEDLDILSEGKGQ